MESSCSESVEIIDGNKNEFVHPLYHQNKPYFLNSRADFAKELLRAALAIAKPGECREHYQVFNFIPPADMVRHACDIADAAYIAFEQRGWVVPVPTRSEAMQILQNGSAKGAGFTK